MKSNLVHWSSQPHGSFSSLGRWRAVSLTEFSTAEALGDERMQYLAKNDSHRIVSATEEKGHVRHLCQFAVEESNRLVMGCLIEDDLPEKVFCLITQLGNRPTRVQFVRRAAALRETLPTSQKSISIDRSCYR